MVQVSYPGVYVQELSSGVRAVTGVSTSIAAFVGMASKGVLFQPTRVLSYADYERAFGYDSLLGEMTTQVRQFFLNGGQEAFVVRVANGAVEASVVLDGKVKLTAKDAGTFGDTLRARVDYDTPTPEATFNLTVFRETYNASGQPSVSEVEVHRDLTMDTNSARHFATYVSRESRLVTATSVATVTPTAGASMSAIMPAAADAAINAAVTGAVGTLQVRVGPSPWVTASVASGGGLAGLQSAINTALSGTGASVTATHTANQPIVITAGGFGAQHDVQIRPGTQADIAVTLGFGTAQGGVERGAFAAARPAVSGGISTLGSSLTDYLVQLAALNRPTLVSLVGAPGFDLSSITYSTAGTTLGQGSRAGTSLFNVRENLLQIAAAINALTNAFRATVSGYRLSILPNFGASAAPLDRTLLLARPNGATPPANVAVLQINVRAAATALGSLGGGTAGINGSGPSLANYRTAFTALDKIDLYNLMVLPRNNSETVARTEVWGEAAAACKAKRAFLLVDPGDWRSIAAAEAGVDALRIGLGAADHAAVYWPPIEVVTDVGRKVVDPSGTIAGLMARIDASRGVWKAPAGLEATLAGALAVQTRISDPENGVLNPKAVNVLRAFPNGLVSWGARTLAGFDNSGNDDYKYVPVRRLALFIEESLVRGLKFAVFEPNDERLWSQLRLAAGGFMNGLFRRGAFAGPKKDDAYFVKVDRETTTQNDINLGIVNVVVGFAPLKPAEFVVITLQQMAGQVQV